MPKSMIFLFDGTANDASSEMFTNVYKINQIISEKRSDKDGNIITQVTFYLPGVGTKFTVRRPRRGIWATLRGDLVEQLIFGDSIDQLILRAYVNLCANFRTRDDIILMGFSRGSAAARIFSRFVSDFGILKSSHLFLLDRLWNQFLEISKIEADSDYFAEIEILMNDISLEFKNTEVFHSKEHLKIQFLGLFDTVIGAVDDEFCKNMNFRDQHAASLVRNVFHIMSMHDVRKEFELKRFVPRIRSHVNLREMWMPGVHSDIGGGYEEDFISNVSLLTMAEMLRKYANISLDRGSYDEVVKLMGIIPFRQVRQGLEDCSPCLPSQRLNQNES